jgi:hypothetical protein
MILLRRTPSKQKAEILGRKDPNEPAFIESILCTEHGDISYKPQETVWSPGAQPQIASLAIAV